MLELRQQISDLRQEVTRRFEELEKRIVAELKPCTLRTALFANLTMAVAFAGIAVTAAGLS